MWLAGLLAVAAPAAADCPPGASLAYVCRVEHPEDVVAIPGTRWLIASGFAPGAGLKLVDSERKASQRAKQELIRAKLFASDGDNF